MKDEIPVPGAALCLRDAREGCAKVLFPDHLPHEPTCQAPCHPRAQSTQALLLYEDPFRNSSKYSGFLLNEGAKSSQGKSGGSGQGKEASLALLTNADCTKSPAQRSPV